MSGVRLSGVLLLWTVLCSCHLEDLERRKPLPDHVPKPETPGSRAWNQPVQTDPSDSGDGTYTMDLTMPGVRPQNDDEYLCTSVALHSATQYIINYEAAATVPLVHHLLLFGCTKPAQDVQQWPCGRICHGYENAKILYAWAKNANPTHLPPDVGYRVGGSSGIKYLVLQIHYRNAIPLAQPSDHSGVHLTLTQKKQTFISGVYLMALQNINIPAHTKGVHGDISCRYNGLAPLHAFAFRVHAHKLSTVISAYQNNGTWSLIGKGNPQWPQAFYPVTGKNTIHPGDRLVARCTYDSTRRDKTTRIGGAHSDEMCNFYMMYYTNASTGSTNLACSVNKFPELFHSIPAGNDVPLPANPLLEEEAASNALQQGNNFYSPGNKPFSYDRLTDVLGGRGMGRIAVPNPRSGYLGRYDDLDEVPSRYEYYADLSDANNRNENPDYFYYEVQHQRSRNRNRRPPHVDHSSGGRTQGILGYDKDPSDYGGTDGAHAFFGFPDDTDSTNPAPSFRSDQPDWRGPAAPPRTGVYAQEHGMYHGNNPNAFRDQGDLRNPSVAYNRNLYPNRQKPQSGSAAPSGGSLNHRGGGGVGGWRSGVGVPSVASSKVATNPTTTTTSSPSSATTTATMATSGSLSGDRATGATHPSGASGSNNHNKEVSSLPLTPSIHETLAWPVITPADHLTIGQIGGIATDSHGNLHVFHRGSRSWKSHTFDNMNRFSDLSGGPIKENTFVTFSPEGKVIRQWGANMFYMPHGLHIDHEDNIWLTDVALHQVMKFPAGSQKPSLVLGTKLTPGSDGSHYCKPSDVTTLTTGEFYVTDGYCNSRVIKYSKEGKMLKQWGKRTKSVASGEFPPPYEFDIPHSITALEDHGWVCVADRENGRIQCFTLDGDFVKQIHPNKFNGRLYAVTYSAATGILYAVNGPNLYGKNVPVLGFSLDPASGKLLETWEPQYGLKNPHDVVVSLSGEYVYVGELDPHKVWQFRIQKRIVQALSHNTLGQLWKRPVSVDGSKGAEGIGKVEEESSADENDFGASMVIGALLIVPVIIIVAVTVFIRLRKKALLNRLKGYREATLITEELSDDEEGSWLS